MIEFVVILSWAILCYYRHKTKYRVGLKCNECDEFIPKRDNQIERYTISGDLPKVCSKCGALNYDHKVNKYDYDYASAESNFKIYNPITWFKVKYNVLETQSKFKNMDKD